MLINTGPVLINTVPGSENQVMKLYVLEDGFWGGRGTIYIYMYIHTHIHTRNPHTDHVCTPFSEKRCRSEWGNTGMCIYIYIYMNACMHACMHVHTHMYGLCAWEAKKPKRRAAYKVYPYVGHITARTCTQTQTRESTQRTFMGFMLSLRSSGLCGCVGFSSSAPYTLHPTVG